MGRKDGTRKGWPATCDVQIATGPFVIRIIERMLRELIRRHAVPDQVACEGVEDADHQYRGDAKQ